MLTSIFNKGNKTPQQTSAKSAHAQVARTKYQTRMKRSNEKNSPSDTAPAGGGNSRTQNFSPHSRNEKEAGSQKSNQGFTNENLSELNCESPEQFFKKLG